MRTILISLILLPILSFAQEKCEKDSIRMTHGIVSMTKITLEFESDTIVKSDTIFEIVRYDKKGRLIEEKYQIGTAVLHKYIYDSNSKLIQEIRLTPLQNIDFNDNPGIYSDTMTVINYHYNNGKIIKADKIDLWGVLNVTTTYTYNDLGWLTMKYDTDSLGNMHDFEIYKLKSDGSKEYSVYNHNQMTSDYLYTYKGEILTKKTKRFNQFKSITSYDKETGKIIAVKHYKNEKLIGFGDYFYNNYGLIEKISSYDVDNDLEVKKLDLLYIYNKE